MRFVYTIVENSHWSLGGCVCMYVLDVHKVSGGKEKIPTVTSCTIRRMKELR